MVILGAVVLLCLIGGFVLWRFEPTDSRWHPKCLLHSWTGYHCPGCGTTRAMHSLLRGRFWDAVRYNPMLIIGGPIIAAAIFWQRRRERQQGFAIPKLTWALFVIMTLYFIARNVPSPSRSWLAPPQATPEVSEP